MFGSRRFMDQEPMFDRGVFKSLGQGATVTPDVPTQTSTVPASAASIPPQPGTSPGASAPPAATSAPTQSVVVQQPSMMSQVLGFAILGGIGVFALEMTGVTHLGLKKALGMKSRRR